jgi:hypothetical protein
MVKNAEDILEEKELDYLRGFLDCATLLNNEAQDVPHDIPAPKPFDMLHGRIEIVYSTAAELYDDAVKRKLGIVWPTEKQEPKKLESQAQET